MRIIKAAKKTDEIVETCDTCGSVLGIKEIDVRWYDSSWTFICPVCTAVNYLDAEEKSELFPWIMEDKDEISSNNTMRINTI